MKDGVVVSWFKVPYLGSPIVRSCDQMCTGPVQTVDSV